MKSPGVLFGLYFLVFIEQGRLSLVVSSWRGRLAHRLVVGRGLAEHVLYYSICTCVWN